MDNYADDSQLYLAFKPSKELVVQQNAIAKIENCIDDIRKWMVVFKLKLNDVKTECMVVGSNRQLAKVIHTAFKALKKAFSVKHSNSTVFVAID